jgi:hypothetical protein
MIHFWPSNASVVTSTVSLIRKNRGGIYSPSESNVTLEKSGENDYIAWVSPVPKIRPTPFTAEILKEIALGYRIGPSLLRSPRIDCRSAKKPKSGQVIDNHRTHDETWVPIKTFTLRVSPLV